MNRVLANQTVSITELKRNPSAVVEAAGDEAVAVVSHNRSIAYLVPAQAYEGLMELIADLRAERDAAVALANPDDTEEERINFDVLRREIQEKRQKGVRSSGPAVATRASRQTGRTKRAA